MHAPFGPMLMEFKMPQPYIDMLNTYGDKISASDKKSKQLDWSDNLVGNVKQEHKIEQHIWQEKPNEHLPSLFNWMGACVNLYVKTKLQQGDEQDSAVAEKGIKKLPYIIVGLLILLQEILIPHICTMECYLQQVG